MIITPLDINYPERIIGPASDFAHIRSIGKPHLTDIIRDLALAIGKPKGDGTISEEDLNAFAMGGWTFEHLWDMAFNKAMTGDPRTIFQPGEYELDGIVGTPDRIRVEEDGSITLIELKCRWMSAYKFDALETNFWQELMQCLSYSKMVDASRFELHVFFVAGNWRPPVPLVKGVQVNFTERELEDNWLAVTSHARRKGWIK